MKIIKQLIFLLLFFLLHISCSNLNKKNKSVETQNDRFELPQKELKGHKLKCDSTIMGLRVDFICNNKLIIEELSQHKCKPSVKCIFCPNCFAFIFAKNKKI